MRKKDSQGKKDGAILVSTPWPLFNRPSVQLGVLKAYLGSRFPDLKVDARHFYLKVAADLGYARYQAISERTWLSETVYAALLFPERMERIRRVFEKEAKGKPLLRKTDFESLSDHVRTISEELINSVNWGRYRLAGFSVCLCQLTSSLYFVREIKRGFPDLPVVMGGSALSEESARGLLRHFPETNFLVCGEGERPLAELVRHLIRSPKPENIPEIPGIITRESPREKRISFSQISNLDTLPIPDYDDYFHLLRNLGPRKSFFPVLPMEASRGCWWRKSGNQKKPSGCAFCSLNLQWEGFRSKSPERAVSEMDELTSKHKLLSVSFMDNVAPAKTSEEMFTRIADMKKDLRLFCEIRATTPGPVLARMKAAGAEEVQIGIEALSTSLLKKLNKGASAIRNLEIMRDCEALGIANQSNLMLCFPGSDEQDVAETLRALAFAMIFRPLKPVRFWLGLGSPVWRNPEDFGIKAMSNHPHYAALFPEAIFSSTRFVMQTYRGDMKRQKKLWSPVGKKLKEWEKSYAALHKEASGKPILTLRNGGDFLIIRQRRLGAEAPIHRLVGKSAEIYRFCQKNRSVRSIAERFPDLGEDKILPFLKMMTEKKLMFEERGRYLSLAASSGR